MLALSNMIEHEMAINFERNSVPKQLTEVVKNFNGKIKCIDFKWKLLTQKVKVYL